MKHYLLAHAKEAAEPLSLHGAVHEARTAEEAIAFLEDGQLLNGG